MFRTGVFGGMLAVFWRGVVLLGACNVLEGHGILEEALAVFWRGVAFWRVLASLGYPDPPSVLTRACSRKKEGLGNKL